MINEMKPGTSENVDDIHAEMVQAIKLCIYVISVVEAAKEAGIEQVRWTDEGELEPVLPDNVVPFNKRMH